MPREKLSDKIKRAGVCIKLLKKHYPNAKCTLDFKTTHQLMVATILSAQCTDERVNKVTPTLFKKYRSVNAFAEADIGLEVGLEAMGIDGGDGRGRQRGLAEHG